MSNQVATVIRPMQLNDLTQVQAIDKMCFSLPWPERSFRYELLENPSSVLWVAEHKLEGGHAVVTGLMVVWLVVDEAHIATLAVHPAYQRQGIARRLLVAALEEAHRRGMVSVTLEVRSGNTAAQELYRGFGFEIVGRRHGYYQDNHEDALLMTLNKLDEAALERLRQSVGEAKTDEKSSAKPTTLE